MGMLQAARRGGDCTGAFNPVDDLTTEAIVEAHVTAWRGLAESGAFARRARIQSEC